MGDIGDYWNDHREHVRTARRLRARCRKCGKSDLWPGQRCRHCGERDPRPKRKRGKRG